MCDPWDETCQTAARSAENLGTDVADCSDVAAADGYCDDEDLPGFYGDGAEDDDPDEQWTEEDEAALIDFPAVGDGRVVGRTPNADAYGEFPEDDRSLWEKADAVANEIADDAKQRPVCYWPAIGPLLCDLPEDMSNAADALAKGQCLDATGHAAGALSDVALAGLDIVSGGEASTAGRTTRALAKATSRSGGAHAARVPFNADFRRALIDDNLQWASVHKFETAIA